MIKNVLRYREMEYANAIYSGGFQTSHIVTEMRLLVMYFRDVLGYTEAKCKSELKNFCDSHIAKFDSVKNWQLINCAMSAFRDKSCLASVPSVDVYESDVSLADSIGESTNERRVIFTLIVFMRIEKTYREYKYGVPYNCFIFGGERELYTRIKRMSCVTDKTNVFGDVVPHLVKSGMATPLVRGRVNLDFIQNYSPTGESVCDITDFDNIGLYYDK